VLGEPTALGEAAESSAPEGVGFMINSVDNLQHLLFLNCFLGLRSLVSLLGKHIKHTDHEIFSLCCCSLSTLSYASKCVRRSVYLLSILPNGTTGMKNRIYEAKLFL
jgi:hypothetical protein